MGRWSFRSRLGARGAAGEQPPTPEWYELAMVAARSRGAMPYLVEGFLEVNEAVRRGHAVMIVREEAEVADGVRIFDPGMAAAGRTSSGSEPTTEDSAATRMVTVLRFDPGTARFVLRDAQSEGAPTELTPKRLERYLADPSRRVGVALGA